MVTFLTGFGVGTAVGAAVGALVGATVGAAVGAAVGAGALVGAVDAFVGAGGTGVAVGVAAGVQPARVVAKSATTMIVLRIWRFMVSSSNNSSFARLGVRIKRTGDGCFVFTTSSNRSHRRVAVTRELELPFTGHSECS